MRRIRFDLIYVYKLLFGMVDLNFDDFFALNAFGQHIDNNNISKFTVGKEANYCDQRVCSSVILSAGKFQKIYFTKFSIHAACGRTWDLQGEPKK